MCKLTDTATFDAEFSDKAEFQNEQNETSEHGIAETLNRESKFQTNTNIITVSLEWNVKLYGYVVYLTDTADGDKVQMTKPQGHIHASKEYREYCKLTFEILFGF